MPTKHAAVIPGPGEYDYQNEFIQTKQLKNLMKTEDQFNKDRGSKNFRMLSKKVTVKPSTAAEKDKTELHLIRKKHFNGLRGPGTYPVESRDTSFNVRPKREQLQCFNSTAVRFTEPAGSETTKAPTSLGPGAYDVVADVYSRSLSQHRVNTAAFLTKRNENLFGIKDIPGPQEYSTNASMFSHGKSWTTTVQAFGSTERRFISQSMQAPGPGEYRSERHGKMAQKFAV